jgi:hypothetical protein
VKRVISLAMVAAAALAAGCGSSTQPPQAANNSATRAAPRVPTEDKVGIDQTWNVPAGTHVTVTYTGKEHCTKSQKNLSFDTGAPPYNRTDNLYTRSIDGVCSVQLSSASFAVKTSTGKTREIAVEQTTLKGLYWTKCGAGDLPCRDSGGATKTTTPRITLG